MSRTVPLSSAGSCATLPMRRRSQPWSRAVRGVPSSVTSPDAGSYKRNSSAAMLDLPARMQMCYHTQGAGWAGLMAVKLQPDEDAGHNGIRQLG